jgi:thiol:disulfide interchange protein DsbD
MKKSAALFSILLAFLAIQFRVVAAPGASAEKFPRPNIWRVAQLNGPFSSSSNNFSSASITEKNSDDSTAVKNGAVTAELVSADASIQPGHTFTIALRLVHDPQWHTYWLNAGTGIPTSLSWSLPEGFTAGKIQWPTPEIARDTLGNIAGNGYSGEVFLLVNITPPATLKPGTDVTLKAKAQWLMCKDVCVPGDADLSLTLPVKAETPSPNPTWATKIAETRKLLPLPLPTGWSASAERRGSEVVLTLNTAGQASPSPSDLHFFSEDGFIDLEKPQTIRAIDGGFQFTLAVSDIGDAKGKRLDGVIRSQNGWGEKGPVLGLLVDVPLKTAAVTAPIASRGSLIPTLFLALIGGLILNLMPCVFPVLGIKILGFVNQAGKDLRKVKLHGLAFTAGVLVSFWALAGLLIGLRAGGRQFGWGFQLQSPEFVFGMAIFLLIFALNLSGVFEIGLTATKVGGKLQMKEGFSGSFFTGMLATLVATPCSAPFLAPALGAALTFSALESLLVFTAIAIGLALPYLLLSVFPKFIRLLPKPGAWMETFKQFMAFPLYASVGWLLWVLDGQTRGNENALLNIAFAFVLVAMAAWIYGRFGQAFGKPVKRTVGCALAIIFLAGGIWMGLPGGDKSLAWQPWSAESVSDLRDKGKYIYVDFTARWCATCQSNKKLVFSSDKVRQEFKKRGVVLLRADWTNFDPKITEELARWNRSAVPFDLLYVPGKNDPVVLPELLTAGKVLDILHQAEKK